jgi:hypothetical protein
MERLFNIRETTCISGGVFSKGSHQLQALMASNLENFQPNCGTLSFRGFKSQRMFEHFAVPPPSHAPAYPSYACRLSSDSIILCRLA